MLNPGNSESCLSQFLLLVRPKHIEVAYETTVRYDLFTVAQARYNDAKNYENGVAWLIDDFEEKYPKKVTVLKSAMDQVNRCLDAIESYLLSFLSDESGFDLDALVSSTFGYFLSDEAEKQRMKAIFSLVKEHLISTVNTAEKRAVFSRTLLGTAQLIELEGWVHENADELMSSETTSEILQLIMPKLVEYSENKCLRAIVTESEIPNIAAMWINGISYKQILDYATENNVLIVRRKKQAEIQLGEIIDICDDGFGYASTLIINALSELLQLNYGDSEDTCKLFAELSRQMRYGLPTKKSIIIYESGFGDRAIAIKLAAKLSGISIKNRRGFQSIARKNKDSLLDVLEDFPRIFTDRVIDM